MTLLYGMCEHYDCNLRNNAGYCQATVCMNPHYNGWTNKEATVNHGRNVNLDEIKAAVEQYRKQHMTHADRIRAMTDEELAEWMTVYAKQIAAQMHSPYQFAETYTQDALDFLKSPVEVDK